MGYRAGQHALLARGMTKDNNREQRAPKQQCALNASSHQWWGSRGGIHHLAAHAYGAYLGAGGVPPDTASHAPSVRQEDLGQRGTPHAAACKPRMGMVEIGGSLRLDTYPNPAKYIKKNPDAPFVFS